MNFITKKNKKLFSIGFIIAAVILTANSCNKDSSEEEEAQHILKMSQMKTEYGIIESEHAIGDGIYLKVLHESMISNPVKPSPDNYIIADILGRFSNGDIGYVTDYSIAVDNGVAHEHIIYGPHRFVAKNYFSGFTEAIQHVSEGETVLILFPHDQAFYGYEPLAFEITLHRVIEDIEQYTQQEMAAYNEAYEITNADTIPFFGKAFYKNITESTVTPSYVDIKNGDIVTAVLYGYYAETDNRFRTRVPGRRFFPYNLSGDTIELIKGSTIFPSCEILDQMLDTLYVNETGLIITPPEYAFGEEGFLNPVHGNVIIPAHMPLHYTVEIIKVESQDP